ncbi:MAG: hypothetical protein V7K23_00390 [Nostoc sp.]
MAKNWCKRCVAMLCLLRPRLAIALHPLRKMVVLQKSAKDKSSV